MKIDESYLVRRKFLCTMVGGGAAALGVGAALPIAYYAANLRDEPAPEFIELEKDTWDLPPGKSKMVAYGPIPALLIKTPGQDSRLKVFVAICTHFDCTVGYLEKENRIFCACHEGYYDIDGKVLRGPPPSPLVEFEHRFRGDKLVIALEKENLEKAFAEPQT